MKTLMIAIAIAVVGLVGALRAGQAKPAATADCCDGGACCTGGACCNVK
jgi:hypothetical protein